MVKRVRQARQKIAVKKHEKTVRYIAAALIALVLVALVFVFAALSPGSSSNSFAKCKLTALSCSQNILTGVYSGKAACAPSCRANCMDSSGNDLMAQVPVNPSSCPESGDGPATACSYCVNGQADLITGIIPLTLFLITKYKHMEVY